MKYLGTETIYWKPENQEAYEERWEAIFGRREHEQSGRLTEGQLPKTEAERGLGEAV